MTTKTCNNPNVLSNCKYKTIESLMYGCNYEGYCDYQAPRDYREEKLRIFKCEKCGSNYWKVSKGICVDCGHEQEMINIYKEKKK